MVPVKRLLIGAPLKTESEITQHLPKWKALAVFSSDALSSVSYGPEQVVKGGYRPRYFGERGGHFGDSNGVFVFSAAAGALIEW